MKIPLATQLKTARGVPEPRPEYLFCLDRMWRFDFAWPDWRIAVEHEGGTWSGGRHTRGKGFEADCVKYNTATVLGWQVLRFTSDQISRGEALEMIEDAFDAKRAAPEQNVFCALVQRELSKASASYAPMANIEHAYTTILEEVQELFDEIRRKPKDRDWPKICAELVQIAAMAQRTAEDLRIVPGVQE